MHTHPAIAIVTGILVGFGLKLVFFSVPTVAADGGSTKRDAVMAVVDELSVAKRRVYDLANRLG